MTHRPSSKQPPVKGSPSNQNESSKRILAKSEQPKDSTDSQSEPELPLHSAQIPQKLERLKKDNQRLRREKEVLREALFLMGNSV